MSTNGIIAIILSSSLLSSFLTLIGQWYLSNRNYKREYYKKILDKRIEAYIQLEGLTNILSEVMQIDEKVCLNFCYSFKNYSNLKNKLLLCRNFSMWMEKETEESLGELNFYFHNNIENKITNYPNDLDRLQAIGINLKRETSSKNRTLKNLLYKDLKELHNIKSFLNKPPSANNEKIQLSQISKKQNTNNM